MNYRAGLEDFDFSELKSELSQRISANETIDQKIGSITKVISQILEKHPYKREDRLKKEIVKV